MSAVTLPAPIMTAAGERAHALAVAQADEAKSLVLDLERPLRAGRRDFGKHGSMKPGGLRDIPQYWLGRGAGVQIGLSSAR